MIQNIQTLRAVFALLVITGHLEVLYTYMGLVDPKHTIDGVATDGFLVVSAFVIIFSSLRKPTSGADFLGRRFARLVPFYWAITLFVAALDLLMPALFQSTHITAETLSKSLLFIPFVKHGEFVAPIVFVGWTMNYIVFFLALHATNLYLFGRRAWMATAGVLAGLAVYGFIAQPTDVVVKFFTGPRQLSFALGALMAGVWNARPVVPKIKHNLSLRAIAVGLMIAGVSIRIGQQIWFPHIDLRYVGPFMSSCVVLGALMLESNGDVHKGKVRDRIAEATFSIYLTHYFITQAAQKAVIHFDIHNMALLVAMLVAAYVGSVILGLLVCQWVEKPLDKVVRDGWRKLTERPQIAAADEAPANK